MLEFYQEFKITPWNPSAMKHYSFTSKTSPVNNHMCGPWHDNPIMAMLHGAGMGLLVSTQGEPDTVSIDATEIIDTFMRRVAGMLSGLWSPPESVVRFLDNDDTLRAMAVYQAADYAMTYGRGEVPADTRKPKHTGLAQSAAIVTANVCMRPWLAFNADGTSPVKLAAMLTMRAATTLGANAAQEWVGPNDLESASYELENMAAASLRSIFEAMIDYEIKKRTL